METYFLGEVGRREFSTVENIGIPKRERSFGIVVGERFFYGIVIPPVQPVEVVCADG